MEIDVEQLPIPDWGLACPKCRYLLVGLPAHRCPECGTELDMTELIKSWHRLRDPTFTGHELPIPDWGLTCTGCQTLLAGWTSHDCPACGRRFDPWPVKPTPDEWFVVDEELAGEVLLAAVEPLLASQRVPFARQTGKLLREIYAGPSMIGTRLRVPREFYFDVLWLLQDTREKMAAARRRGDDPGWRCPKCGEPVPEHFDVCWNCETPRRKVTE